MVALGDGYVVTSGLIKGDTYSFLIDSKAVLWIQTPRNNAAQQGVPIFFFGVSVSVAIGVWVDRRSYALILPLLFVAGLALTSLIRSFFKETKHNEWRLFVGSTEDPVLIYSSRDAEAFAAKRTEIERALLERPMSEEE